MKFDILADSDLNDMFSVIIPLYNKEETIVRAVNSVLSQTYQNFEIIVIDDGSSDNSLNVVSKIQDNRFRIIHQENGGVSKARNRGIEEAKYDYIAFLDADDEWDNNFLSTITQLIYHFPQAIIYGTNYKLIDIYGNIYDTLIKGYKSIEVSNNTEILINNYFNIVAKSSPIAWTCCVVIRKNDLLAINGFPIGIKSGEDLLTWARLLVKGSLAYSLEPHAIYHLAAGYEYGVEPVRRQDVGDPVGKELVKLYEENKNVIGLREYISHWHKMRASVAIRFGERRETLTECLKALKYNICNYKVYPFMILACLPEFLQKKIIKLKKH